MTGKWERKKFHIYFVETKNDLWLQYLDCMKNLQPFPFPFVDAAGDTMDGKKEGLNFVHKHPLLT